MKKYFILLMLVAIVIGCQKVDDIDPKLVEEHNEQVLSDNRIEENVFYNDFLGIRINMGQGFDIHNYEELNLPEESKEMGNLLMYATGDDLEVIVVTESMYKGNKMIDDIEESLKLRFTELNIESELDKDQIVINDEETTVFKIKEDYGDNKLDYYNYYFIYHRDSLITILLNYNNEANDKLPNEFLKWIELY